MGNPLRFLGSGAPIAIDGVVIPAHCAVEVTFRTHQQRLLLRPDRGTNELLLGCFGRAYDRYPSLNVLTAGPPRAARSPGASRRGGLRPRGPSLTGL